MRTPTVIVVAGPTGSGKTDLALDLAATFGGEIVNCDSIQVYRYLNIGSAKTPLAERRGIPHHMIDIIDPDQIFTAGDYQRAGRSVLRDIAGRGRIAIVVGGTGFYLRALLNGIFEGPGRDDQLRARLGKRRPGSLHRLLKRFDSAAAERIHANDTQKLIRALEVCLLAREPITSLHTHNRLALEGFNIIRLGLDPPREALTARIHTRCEHMFQAGLVDETRSILSRGFPRDSKGLESIGYRECLLHLEGQLSLPEAIARTQIATRQYAKRQRTWFRGELGFHWFGSFGNHKQTVQEAIGLVSSLK